MTHDRPSQVAAMSLVFAALLSACEDTSGTGPPPEEETPAPASMVVAPEQITMETLGDTIRFTATVWDGMGRVVPDAPLTWYTSDESVAVVDSFGLATSVGDGTATILAAAAASVFGWGEMTVTAKALAIVTQYLRPGVVGVPYSQMLGAEGATEPAWSVVAGQLPEGLSLDPIDGEIHGTPTAPGESFFTVQLSNGSDTVTRSFTMGVIQEALGIDLSVDQFALIPAGSFQMGSEFEFEYGYNSHQPVHSVNITQPFLMQKTEVTQYQWVTVMGGNPSGFPNCGDICPVENISWEGIQVFLERLNETDPGKNYRLPTEAQWEYAARAGTTGDYGIEGEDPDEFGWFATNSGFRTHFVAQKKANAWGLFDIHGNVAEWVQDWGADDYYSVSPTDDPSGPATGDFKVMRGGRYSQGASFGTSWRRSWTRPVNLGAELGFRLVRDPPG